MSDCSKPVSSHFDRLDGGGCVNTTTEYTDDLYDDTTGSHEFEGGCATSRTSRTNVTSQCKEQLHQLYSYIWVSGFMAAILNIDEMIRMGIRQVVNVHDTDVKHNIKLKYKKHGIKYVWLETLEHPTTDIIEKGIQVAKLIRAATNNQEATLVHCWAGINRSVSCIIVTRMLDGDDPQTLDEALHHIQSRRFIARPFDYFSKQMRRFQSEIDVNRLSGDASLFV